MGDKNESKKTTEKAIAKVHTRKDSGLWQWRRREMIEIKNDLGGNINRTYQWVGHDQ